MTRSSYVHPLARPACSPAALSRVAQAVAVLGSALCLLALAPAAYAQAQGTGGLRVVPTLDLNVDVGSSSLAGSAGYENTRSGDVALRVRPGLQMSGRLGRTSLDLTYELDLRQHSRPFPGQADSDRARSYLRAALSSELVDRVLFVDATANISQQTVSPYGQQSVDDATYNPNRTEVAEFSVRPYTRGSLAGYANYDLSVNASTTQVKGTISPDSRTTGGMFGLSSPSSAALLGWSVQASQQSSRFSGGQVSDSSRVSLSLKLRPDIDWQGALRGGYEAVKIPGVYDATYSNYGGELRWTPSPRTTALFSADQRYFGRSYQVLLEHRLQRASFRLSSAQDVSNNASANGIGSAVTLYQLFFIQFASLQPDPVLRDQMVRDFLASIGQDPNAIVAGGFVNAGVTLQRREDLSFTYTGQRSTFVLQAYGGRVVGLGNSDPLFSTPTRQYGLTGSWNYRMTPERTVTLSSNSLLTQGNGLQAGNRVRSVNLNLSERLGRNVTASVAARYSLFDGPTNPYHETSLGASLSLRF